MSSACCRRASRAATTGLTDGDMAYQDASPAHALLGTVIPMAYACAAWGCSGGGWRPQGACLSVRDGW